MAKLNNERIRAAFQPHLQAGEELRYWAYGVKQPNFFLFLALFLLAIIPGIIAIVLLTKHYLIGLTDNRFLVLEIKGVSNAEVKQITEYSLDELRGMQVKQSAGKIFTHISIDDENQPFEARFHRAFSKDNRPHAIAIGEAIALPRSS